MLEARFPVKVIEHLVTCLATMPRIYAACPVCVTIFSIGSNANFTELHALTLAVVLIYVVLFAHIATSRM